MREEFRGGPVRWHPRFRGYPMRTSSWGWLHLGEAREIEAPEGVEARRIAGFHRLRWRIELAFKRAKSSIGLAGPPGFREASAEPWVLAHLPIIFVLEPFVDELEDSAR